jgi:hypothetical protein
MYFGLHEQQDWMPIISFTTPLLIYIRPMRWTLLAFIMGYALLSCVSGCFRNKSQQDFDFSRLTGSWSSVDSISSQIEEWQARTDSNYVGRGYVLEGGDTTFLESLEIRKDHGVWTYYAKVNQMNGGEVVPFRLTKQTPERVEFTNLAHDFPKKIGYELVSNNELQAYIEGPRDGQTIRILFDFKRNF